MALLAAALYLATFERYDAPMRSGVLVYAASQPTVDRKHATSATTP